MTDGHTPGPWLLFTTEKGGFTIGAENENAVVCGRNDWSHRAAESIANAHLIAASPDYAAAVEQMLANAQGGCTGDGWWRGWEMLKAAHAKAKVRLNALTEG